METIFYYDNYRDFLRDSHDVKNRACFSWRAISRRAKINNPNFLRQVMQGGKNLSLKTIEPVGKALGLRGEELAYWFELVNYCQSEPGENRERLRLELAKMKGSIRPVTNFFGVGRVLWALVYSRYSRVDCFVRFSG